MRHPTTHTFLKWLGPTVVLFGAGCLGLVATFAQAYPGVKEWGQDQFDQWWPFVTAPWFLVAASIVIAAYLGALAWTGRARNVDTDFHARKVLDVRRTPRPEMPIWRAVEHVSKAIGDNDDQRCYPTALNAIRQAALEGRIEIWGQRELEPPSPRGSASDVWTAIEPAYWNTHKINSMATGMAWHQHDHTYGEPLNIRAQDRYWALQVRSSEIEREWPHV